MLLIIGYGNSLRRDDGAGLILAEMLERACRTRQIEVERIVAHQLTPELSLEVARPAVTTVVFVDTREVASDETNAQVQLEPVESETPSPSVGHHLNPVSLLVYARLLYSQHPPAWELTVPGLDFGHGEGLSPTTQRALTVFEKSLHDLIDRLMTEDYPNRTASSNTANIICR